MKYGALPKSLGFYDVKCQEMMFYQYYPVKFSGSPFPAYEKRLDVFSTLIGAAACDFIGQYGLDRFVNSYAYLTAKHSYQTKGNSFNRPGWHSDGFLTEDINYIWSDAAPTLFNLSEFKLTLDDQISLQEMEEQADPNHTIRTKKGYLLRLDQYNIHKVDTDYEGMRTFVKISFSRDKYNLVGNSHNYEVDYKWDMVPRKSERNIPQS